MLGILTEQLVPIDEDAEKHIRIVTNNVKEAPTAVVSGDTVKRVIWLLNEVRGSLDTERKQTIGKLVTKANLNSPGISNTSTEQPQAEETGCTKNSEGPSTVDSDDTSDDDSGGRSDGGNGGTLNHNNSNISNSDSGDTPDPNRNSRGHKNDTKTKPKYNTSSDTGRIFECEFCTETFEYRNNLMSHSIKCKERPEDARYQCPHCTNEYVSESALSKHLDGCKEKNSRIKKGGRNGTTPNYRCSECGSAFESSQELIKHRRSHTGPESQSHSHTNSKTALVKRGATGEVVHFSAKDGYGFIDTYDEIQTNDIDSNDTENLFFHISEYPSDKAKKGDPVQFNIRRTKQGYRAINISYADPEEINSWDGTFASLRPRWGKDS
ncbi:C2H2-type zinc finger protein [Natrialba sp. INN-245]|uniref:C2H2-type zinc finger protein n=1 Tax=Natrialba sp. INN-245 TaxID=2690967 RepID=UPI0013595C90|nr:C2H2-type zinc finger protein [Natrialba sp. INN-245]